MAFRLPALRQSVIPIIQTRGNLSLLPSSFIQARTMASVPRKYEFLVIVPDYQGVLQKRLEVRSKHMEGLKPNIDSGVFKTGGAILHGVPKDDEPSSLDFAGSTLVLVAESKESVIELLKKDIYATSGVWDVDKAQIYPIKTAFRVP